MACRVLGGVPVRSPHGTGIKGMDERERERKREGGIEMGEGEIKGKRKRER